MGTVYPNMELFNINTMEEFMDTITMYQYLLIDESGTYESGDFFLNEPLPVDEARELHRKTRASPVREYLRFEQQHAFSSNLTIRTYSVTYTVDGSQPRGFFFESAMSITVANLRIVIERVLAVHRGCVLPDTHLECVEIIAMAAVGFGGKATVIDVATGRSQEPSPRIGNVANHILNLLSIKSYTSVAELLDDVPNRQGFSGPNKRRAFNELVRFELVLDTPIEIVITEKGVRALTPIAQEELTKPEPKVKKQTALSETGQGLLLMLSDGVPRLGMEPLRLESLKRGLSNHMNSIERALGTLVKRGFVSVDEGVIQVTGAGLEQAKTCTCARLNRSEQSMQEVITPADAKAPVIFFKKALAQFRAIPNNLFTEVGFTEFCRVRLEQLGIRVSTEQVAHKLSLVKDRLDL